VADPRFFKRAGPFCLGELADISRSVLASEADGDADVCDVSALNTADETAISFFESSSYADQLLNSHAGFCVVRQENVAHAPPQMGLLINKKPQQAYARIAAAFYPDNIGVDGIDANAHVDATSVVDPTASISAGAVVGAFARIGPHTRIGSNTVVGQGVQIGTGCRISTNCSLSYCLIGDHVSIDAGSRLGEPGFGFVIDPAGHTPIPQLGRVIVEDGVSIGSNTTIDRGAGPDTIIRKGTIIDNQVQIAHNVEVGELSVLVSQVGISGSTKLGRMVMLGGQVGLTGHLSIGAGVKVMAKSGVYKDVAPGVEMAGAPAMSVRDFWRQQVKLKKLINRKGN